ncbi:MAG: hypothetical protein EBT83_18180 [Betaproteobacteria bacterium]|jgi:thiosulfate reductase cytochrome b subunit|nr:hypothetical protein [Betaproteobacteria bacterium]
MTSDSRTFVLRWPQSLPGRIIAGVLALAGIVAAFFFLFFVLLAAGLAIVVLYLRSLWRRRAQPDANPEIIEGEYSVEPANKARLDDKSGGRQPPG